jgi:heptosyltransferase-3
VLDHAVPAEPEIHRIVELLRLVECLGIAPRPELVCPTALSRPSTAVGAPTGRYAVLHANPMFRFRRWTDAGWRALAQALGQRGLGVVVTGGPDAAEDLPRPGLAPAELAVVRLEGKLEWPALADLLRGAAVYVGPDTSMTHLAAASGCPTVAPTARGLSLIGPWPVGGLDAPWARAGRSSTAAMSGRCRTRCPVRRATSSAVTHLESYSRCLDSSPSQVLAAVDQALGR